MHILSKFRQTMVHNGFHRFCQRQPTNEITRLRRIKNYRIPGKALSFSSRLNDKTRNDDNDNNKDTSASNQTDQEVSCHVI